MKISSIVYLIGVIFFLFTSESVLGDEMIFNVKQSIKLKDLNFSSKNRLVRVAPEDGFIIEVKGEKEKKVSIELYIKEENNNIKVIELNPEKKVIRLDKNGRGTFKVGALIAVKGSLNSGKHFSEVKAEFKYLE